MAPRVQCRVDPVDDIAPLLDVAVLVDLHGRRDLGMPQDLLSVSWVGVPDVLVERGGGVPLFVEGDRWDAGQPAEAFECALGEILRIERSTRR